MIKTNKQRFCCVETKDLEYGHVDAREYYEAVRDNETEYRIIMPDGRKEFRATREELLGCGYLC